MSKSKVVAALSLAVLSFAAHAGGGDVGVYASENTARPGAGLTRAEVRAERDAALARGELHRFGEAGPLVAARPSTRTRAEVRAERDAALARGELHRFGEASPLVAAQPSTRTRGEVQAELLEAIRLGVYGSGGEASPPIATPAQEAQIAAAGRAAAHRFAAMQ
jgi:hypothetical protein